MKNHLLKLAKYNKWANQKFIQSLNAQEENFLFTQLDSSFKNIFETCKHIWLGELGWLARMENKGWQTKALDNFQGEPKDLFTAWQITSDAYIKFIETEDLTIEIEFMHDEINYSIPRSDMILTIINHGNYHRGQIVTMLRQLGINKIPKTDYIEWVREQRRKETI